MASRQNYPSVLSSNSTANVKEKSSHSSNKTETSKLKHDKNSSSSSSSSGHIPLSSSNTIINNMSKRKGTSFQITSVSVSSANSHHHSSSSQQVQRNSTDNNNDYETPSISETFSGEDVFFAQQNAFGTAPVIPTSSQYGLAIVGPDHHGTDVHVSVSDAGINIMGPISSKQDPDHKNERFKVVKIESTEPFKRGRWMCMDYLDHTTLQDDGIDGKDGDENMKNEHHEAIVGPRVLIMNNGEIEHIISDNEDLDHEVNKINSKQQLFYNHQDVTQNTHQNTSHPQTMTSIPTYIDHSSSTTTNNNNNNIVHSMPQRQLEQLLTQEKQLTLHLSHDNNNTNSSEHAGIATLNGPHQSEMLPQSSNENNINSNNNTSQQQQSIVNQQHFMEHHQHAQTMTQEMIHSMVHSHDQQNHLQGLTLPTNILMQNISHEHHQQQSQLNSPNSSNALPLSSIPTQNMSNINVTENASLTSAENEFSNNNCSNINSNNQDNMTNQFQASQVVTGDRIQQQSESDNQQQTGNLVTNEINLSNNSDSNNNITVSNDGTQQNASSPSSSAGIGTVVEGAAGIDISESASNNVNSGNNNSNATGGIDDGQAISEDNESKTAPSMTQKVKEKKCIGCTPGGLATTALTMNLSTISPLCTNVGCIGASCSKDANASSRVSRSASPALGNTSDNPRFRIGYLKKLFYFLLIFEFVWKIVFYF
ncbi:hypothetical protein ACKWTF_000838 [Chironomus riparius]